jgi:hypothetical protein
MSIKSKIQASAETFTKSILTILANASLQELMEVVGSERKAKPTAPKNAKPENAKPENAKEKPKEKEKEKEKSNGKRTPRARRDPDAVQKLQQDIVEYVEQNPREDGLAISDIVKGMNLPMDHLILPVRRCVQEGRLRKEGEKKNTRYFLGTPVASSSSGETPTEEDLGEAAEGLSLGSKRGRRRASEIKRRRTSAIWRT